MPKSGKITLLLLLAALLACGFVKSPQRGDAPSAPQAPHDSLRPLYLYTEALKRAAIDSNRREARRLLDEAVAADAGYAPAWYELAGMALDEEPDSAVVYARRAVQRDSSDKWYLHRLGQALLNARRYAEALPVYEKIVRTAPSHEAFRILAILYEQQERPFSAIAILDSADGQFGRLPWLVDIKRRLLLRTRQSDRALDEARRDAEAVPYDPENHIALGEVYEFRGEDSLAHASFRRAVEVDSSSLYAWASLGDYYIRHQEHRANLEVSQNLFRNDRMPLADKLEMFRRYTADRRFYREYYAQIHQLAATLYIKYPDSAEVIDLYVRHLIDSGEIEQALAICKSHADDVPPRIEYFMMISSIESYLEHPDSAERWLALAVERFPRDPEAHLLLGSRRQLDHRWEAALESYRTALKYADDDTLRSDIWGYIGDLWHARSEGRRADMKRCYAAYDKALKANADNAVVLNNYAYFLSLEGRSLDTALAMSQRAISLAEANPTYLDTYAWVLYRLGRLDEARQAMKQALSLDRTSSPELRLHYGDILAALGENYMAEVYWRRALEYGYADPEAVVKRIEKLKQQTQK